MLSTLQKGLDITILCSFFLLLYRVPTLTNRALSGTQFRCRPHARAVIILMDCLREVMNWGGEGDRKSLCSPGWL